MMLKFYQSILLSITLFLFSACGSAVSYLPIEIDKNLGATYSAQIEANTLQYNILEKEKNEKAYLYLENLVKQILNSSSINYKNDFVYQIKIIKDDSILNAFCVAGGYIYVYTGIIKFLDSDHQLAGVLAHEIAHAERRHTTIQMAKSVGVSLLISYFLGNDFGGMTSILNNLIGLGFSRLDESEADKWAVQYLSETKYDPRGVAYFFEKMIKKGKDASVPAFLSTHPNSDDRIKAIYNTWKELGSKTGKSNPEEYQNFKNLFKNI